MSSELAAAEAKTALYFVSGLEVWSGPGSSAIVALGDSITQGTTKVPAYSDYPDQLAHRIAKKDGNASVGVVNEGINGNRILHDVAGQNALARFDRDVAAQPGARAVIVMEGINDIGFPRVRFSETKNMPVPRENPWKDQKVSADQIIQGLRQIVARAHSRGLRIFVATMTPFAGTNSFDEEGEAIRQSVNAWIRGGNGFDGVVDFDKVLRDGSNPSALQPQFDSGDHIHPSAAGYKAMADSIDLVALLSTDAREKHREMTSK
jgi:lysophospholipase L1-like esterase